MSSPAESDVPPVQAQPRERFSIWRLRAPVGSAARRSLRRRRIVAAALFVTLLLCFYLVLTSPLEHPHIRIATLATVGMDGPAAGPAAPLAGTYFAHEDLLAWQALADRLAPAGDGPSLLEIPPPERASDLEAVGRRLDNFGYQHRDVLLFYLRSEGVVRDGEPCLLCGPERSGEERAAFPLSRLLNQLRDRRYTTKLLILDAGQDIAGRENGVLVNQFSALVADRVQKTGDAGLWVLLSHGPLESSQVLWSKQTSLLTDVLNYGLSGAADWNGDRVIRVDELFRYTSNRVMQAAVQLSDGQATQTPQLCWGRGEIPRDQVAPILAPVVPDSKLTVTASGPAVTRNSGSAPLSGINPFRSPTIAPPAVYATASPAGLNVSLTRPTIPPVPMVPTASTVIGTTPTAIASAVNSAATRPAAQPAPAPVEEAQNDAADGAAATESSAAASGSPAGPEAEAAVDGSDAEQEAAPELDAAAGLLMKVWELCGQLDDRNVRQVTPVDMAPLRWRLLLDDLQTMELRLRTGSAGDAADVEAELLVIQDALSHLLLNPPQVFDPERGELWESVAAAATLPPLQVDSVALALAIESRGGAPVPDEVKTAWQQLNDAAAADERAPFDAWLAALTPEMTRYSEFEAARSLAAIRGLDWPLLRQAVQVRCTGERAAAIWETAPLVRGPAAAGDELRLAAEQMLFDGVDPQRLPRSQELFREAGLRYQEALENGVLLERARTLLRDLSFQAPDYVEWWSATGFSTYRCGPSTDDVAALLGGLAELDRLLRSATATDRDGIQLQAALLESIIERIDPAACAYRQSARRPSDRPRETSWHIQSLLMTALPRAGQRLQLLQDITQLETQQLAALPAGVPNTPIPARTLSLHDWQFIQQSAEFHRDLANLAVLGLPDGDSLIEPLDTQLQSLVTRQPALLATRAVTPDDLFAGYRELAAAFRQFQLNLLARIERPSANSASDIDQLLHVLDGNLQAQRLIRTRHVDRHDLSLPGADLLALSAADLLAWQAVRSRHAAVNADAEQALRRIGAADSLQQQSRTLAGLGDSTLHPTPPFELEVPSLVSLIPAVESVEVRLSNSERSPADIWLVMEYDPRLLQVEAPAGIGVYHGPQLAARYALGRSSDAPQSTATSIEPGGLIEPQDVGQGPPLPEADGSYTGSWWSASIIQNEPPSVTLGDRQSLKFTLRVQRRTTGGEPARLVLKALSARGFTRRLVHFDTPAPPFVALQIAGIEGTSSPDPQGVTLHPFPNRDSKYRYRLVNTLPSPRVVDVALLSLTAPLDRELPEGTLPPDAAAAVLDQLSAAVRVATFDQRPLPPPGAASPPDAASEPEPEEPPPAAGERPPLPDFRYGAVMVVTDHETHEAVFIPIAVETQRPMRYIRPVVRYDLQRERVEIIVRGESAGVMPPEGSTVSADFVEPLDVTATALLEGVLQGPQYTSRLFADVPTAPGKVVHLRLHVDGFPRAFLYTIACDRDAEVPATTDALAIEIFDPHPGVAFATPRAGVPVTLAVDAPVGAFQTLPTRAEVGLDVDRDRFLRNEPILVLPSDRDVDVRLKSFKADGSLTLQTKISDFQVEVPAAGMGTARVNVLGRIEVAGAVAWSEPHEIVLDGTAPRIDAVELHPGRVLGSEDMLGVTVRVDDRTESATAAVELAFDILRTGEFAPDAKLISAGEGEGSSWSAKVPLADLPPGTWGLLVRAVDRTGNVSATHRELVTVLSPEALAARRLQATSPITGLALYGELPVAGANIVLADDKQQVVAETKSNAKGEFELPQVPPGVYQLKSQALVKNKIRTAEAAVTVPEPPDAVAAVKLQLR